MQHFSVFVAAVLAFLSLVLPASGYLSLSDNFNNRLQLPISSTSDGSGGWTVNPSDGSSVNTYSLVIYNMASSPNIESFVLVPDFSTGCSLGTSSYMGGYTPVNAQPYYGNASNPSTNPGIYFFNFNIPQGAWFIMNISYTDQIDSATRVTDWINIAVHNPLPAPFVPSSTGSAPVVWPGGRGPIGLSLQDNCCGSSEVPLRSGWSWSESTSDIGQYSLHVSFVYHLLRNSSFYIERTYGDANLINSTRQQDLDAPVIGDYLGTIDSPILDDTAEYVYNFYIPSNGRLLINLHYSYINPDDPTVVHHDIVPITIGNYFVPSSSAASPLSSSTPTSPCSILGYDLSSIDTADLSISHSWEWQYTIRVCGGPLYNPTPCASDAFVCQASSGQTVGHYNPSAIQWSATSNGLQAIIGNGDSDYCDASRRAIINYNCDPSASQPVIRTLTENPSCVYNFNIATSAVCRR